MRRLVYDQLTEWAIDTNLNAVVERGAVRETRPADPMFAVYAFTSTVPIVPVTALEVWVYSDLGDYERIDSALRALRTRFDNLAEIARVRNDGSTVRLVQVDWLTDGPDLVDDTYRCAIRTGQWRLIGSGQ